MFKILSLDGGGVCGVISARILQEIENRTGKKCSQLFDFIAGTSAGGISTAALTMPKPMSAEEIVGFYFEECSKIFHATLWRKITTLCGIIGASYDIKPFEEV